MRVRCGICSTWVDRVNIGRGKHTKIAYTKNDIDFFAIYLLPEDAWYILPVEFAAGRVGLSVPKKDHVLGTKYESFLNAWHFLDANPGNPNSYATQNPATQNKAAQSDPTQNDPTQNEAAPDEPWSPLIDIKACAEEYDPHLTNSVLGLSPLPTAGTPSFARIPYSVGRSATRRNSHPRGGGARRRRVLPGRY